MDKKNSKGKTKGRGEKINKKYRMKEEKEITHKHQKYTRNYM